MIKSTLIGLSVCGGVLALFLFFPPVRDWFGGFKTTRNFAHALFRPSKTDLQWRNLVKDAYVNQKDGKHDEAIYLFWKAKQIMPDSPVVNTLLARSYYAQKDFDNALNEVQESRKNFQVLAGTSLEQWQYQALIIEANVLEQKKKYSQAKKVLDEMLDSRTSRQQFVGQHTWERTSFLSRSRCNKEMGCLADSLADSLESHGHPLIEVMPIMSEDVSNDFVKRLIEILPADLEVEGSDLKLLASAQLYERIARCNRDQPELAKEALVTALSHYEILAENSTNATLDLKMVDINIRLGQYESAEKILESVLQETPLSLWARIMRVRLYEAQDRKTEARKEFYSINKDIDKVKLLSQPPSTNPLAVLNIDQFEQLMSDHDSSISKL